jgi:hypothetical protein
MRPSANTETLVDENICSRPTAAMLRCSRINAATNAGSIGMQIEQRAPVLKTSTSKRGRPRGTKLPDFHSEVWITVRLYRIRLRISIGRTPSIKKVCDELASRGGVISAIGGDVAKLAEECENGKKRWPRFEVDSTGLALTPSSAGPIFSNHTTTNPDTLRARYNEANRITKYDRRAWLFWKNLCRQRLGFPAKGPRPQRAAQSNA